MGLDDKIQETVGKAKEGVGEAVGNEDLRAEGQKDRVKGSMGQMVDSAKEKLGDVARRKGSCGYSNSSPRMRSIRKTPGRDGEDSGATIWISTAIMPGSKASCQMAMKSWPGRSASAAGSEY